jgi:hypothetical protein
MEITIGSPNSAAPMKNISAHYRLGRHNRLICRVARKKASKNKSITSSLIYKGPLINSLCVGRRRHSTVTRLLHGASAFGYVGAEKSRLVKCRQYKYSVRGAEIDTRVLPLKVENLFCKLAQRFHFSFAAPFQPSMPLCFPILISTCAEGRERERERERE